MIYFILWVVFLLTVLLAVPIASYLEKRKYRAANPAATTDPIAVPAGEDGGEWSEDEPGQADPMSEDDSISGGRSAANQADDAVEFGEVDGGDEFAAFDDI